VGGHAIPVSSENKVDDSTSIGAIDEDEGNMNEAGDDAALRPLANLPAPGTPSRPPLGGRGRLGNALIGLLGGVRFMSSPTITLVSQSPWCIPPFTGVTSPVSPSASSTSSCCERAHTPPRSMHIPSMTRQTCLVERLSYWSKYMSPFKIDERLYEQNATGRSTGRK